MTNICQFPEIPHPAEAGFGMTQFIGYIGRSGGLPGKNNSSVDHFTGRPPLLPILLRLLCHPDEGKPRVCEGFDD